MSTALSGPAQSIGTQMKQGVEACFNQVNDTGGVHGNTLKLVVYDDGYEPDRCAANMRKLIDEDRVLAVIGNTGAPNAIVSAPIAREKKTLLFAAATGAPILRPTPPERYIINYRAGYDQETAVIVRGLAEAGIRPGEIAFFTQNDGYGDAGYNGAIRALAESGYAGGEKLPRGRYTRNTVNVENALATLINAKPRAIIMVGTYKPCAAFIRMAREFLPDTLYVSLSSVGSLPLARELEKEGEGIIVTQVVPPPETDLPLTAEFRQAMARNADTVSGFTALEGYIAARILTEGLKKAGPAPTRETVTDGLNQIRDLDIGLGLPITPDDGTHQVSHKVWPTILKNGRYAPLNWSDLRKQN
ncbi:ligand-binding receptor [Desulfonema ishimotonii]|uniref:Ligand-binding receptor n=2 Tax=Desulfonema ishimotonii TaxID=45657 RepID=A0A401G2K6_9BACT|nr:ligand-binding receptor [Desulfonema ishimotonii]